MALSNIFREPRREITESVIGLAIFGVPIAADVAFGFWVHADDPSNSVGFGMFAGLVLAACGLFVLGVTVAVLILTHALGELVCDVLQSHGIYLRPRARILTVRKHMFDR